MTQFILFVSSASQSSMQCLHMMRSANIAVQAVRLDTKEARDKAKSGKYFQITNVPSLLIIYEDGNMQLFVSFQKISQIVSNMRREEPPPEEEPHVPAKRKKKKAPKSKKTIVYEDDEPDEIEILPEPPTKHKPSKRGKKQPPQPRKGTKSTSVFDIAKKMQAERDATLGYDPYEEKGV